MTLAMLDTKQFRLTLSQRVWSLGMLFLPIGEVVEQVAVGHLNRDWLIFPAVFVVLILSEFLLLGTLGVDLEDDFAVVRGLRQRRVAWDHVQSIEVRPFVASQVVVLVTADRRFRPQAPISGPFKRDAAFEQKAETIRWWWITHRSVVNPLPPDVGITFESLQPDVRSRAQSVQLFASIILAIYAAFIILLAILLLVVSSVLKALEITVPGLVAVTAIALLWPTRPRIRRWPRLSRD